MDLLESHYHEPNFGVPEMIEHLAMSKTQLNRKIRALSDHSTGQFLRNFRLMRASQIIEKGENFIQAAYAVGFSNLSYLAKCFKNLFGQTHTEFSKSIHRRE